MITYADKQGIDKQRDCQKGSCDTEVEQFCYCNML